MTTTFPRTPRREDSQGHMVVWDMLGFLRDTYDRQIQIPQPVVNGQWLKGSSGVAVWAAITLADLPAGTLTPTGALLEFAGSSAPTGYLFCDGSAVSRTTYAALFGVIGTTWGVGDGSTTFNVPDLRGRSPVGAGAGPGLTTRTLATKAGEESHLLVSAENGLRQHTHYVRRTANDATGRGAPMTGDFQDRVLITGPGVDVYVDNTGPWDAAQGHNNMQPFVVVNYIIKT